MFFNPDLSLNSGYKIPQLGFGTFDAPKEVVANAVELALSVGFRHIDGAKLYNNEKEVGDAIATSMKRLNLKREDIFITSKLWCDKHAPKDVREACETSMNDLGVQYLDLYLIHRPESFRTKDGGAFNNSDPDSIVFEDHKLEDTWEAMEELVHAGLVRSIGVSNFNKRQLERILASCRIPPAVNQIEVNIHWHNTKLIEFCQSKNILVEGYAPLGSTGFVKGQVRPVLEEANVAEIARRHKKTPAQVLLRHGLQRGIVVLVKSVTPERIRSNFDVFDFELTDEEMGKLNATGVNQRVFRALALVNHPEYAFKDDC
ncbi:Prostaglandin F synthase 1 [Taenia crassiceps]|uniref:Prostaglandin F synthase 1 n=1 Tax=Taenia crassiceps TaxID=6207 RepID=A0ABR4QAV5_9CEST